MGSGSGPLVYLAAMALAATYTAEQATQGGFVTKPVRTPSVREVFPRTQPQKPAVKGIPLEKQGSTPTVTTPVEVDIQPLVDAWPPTIQSPQDLIYANTLDPFNVRFSQSSISYRFRNGSTIDDLAQAPREGTVRPEDVPPIRIFERGRLIHAR